MCAVSAVGDNWQNIQPLKWPNWTPPSKPQIWPTDDKTKALPPFDGYTQVQIAAMRREIDAMKREIEELRTLLMAAKKFDEATGQPDCEQGEKVALIKKIAKIVGVDMSDVFPGSV